MCDSWFALRADDLHVEVSEPAGGRQCHLDHPRNIDHGTVEEIKEGTVHQVLSHKPKLSPRAIIWKLRR